MAPSRRVFISHTRELADFPEGRSFVQAAIAAVNRACLLPSEMLLSFTAADQGTADISVSGVRESDIFIGLLGFKYGTKVPGEEDQSYTELEYETARLHEIPRFMFLLDETAVLPAVAVRDNETGGKQEEFRQRVLAARAEITVHYFDTPASLELLVYQALVPAGGYRLFMAPEKPKQFVPRRDLTEQVLRGLAAAEHETVGLTTALKGAGGFGKTTLAAWICHLPEIQERYRRILWIELGDDLKSAELLVRLSDLCFFLSGSRETFSTPHQAGVHLGRLLDGAPSLLVVDDVWSGSDLEPFLIGGAHCARLITSRKPNVLPEGFTPVEVDQMNDGETLSLIRYGLESYPAREFQELIRLSGNWPLLLRIINGVLRKAVDRRAPLREAVERVSSQLRDQGPGVFDVRNPARREEAVTATMAVGLEALEREQGAAALRCYTDLAIFPKDVHIPLKVLDLYWGSALQSTAQGWMFCNLYADLSLVQSFNAEAETLRLQPVIADFLRQQCREHIASMNQRLLDAFRPRLESPDLWHSLPESETYLWHNLAFHLVDAGLGDELVRTLCDGRYLATKTLHHGPEAVQADLDEALRRVDPTHSVLIALQTIFRRAARPLTGFDRLSELAATLRVWLRGVDVLGEVAAAVDSLLQPPYLEIEWSHAESGLGDNLGSHAGDVRAVASKDDGATVASAGIDHVVIVWDRMSRRIQHTIEGSAPANDVAFDGFGTNLAVAWADGSVCVYEVDTGRRVAELVGHEGPANSVQFDESGRKLVSGGADGTIRIWEVESQAQGAICQAHDKWINAVAFDGLGTRVVSGSGSDNSVRIWSTNPDDEPRTLGRHGGPVNAVCFDARGERVLSAGADGIVRIWDADSGEELRSIHAESEIVNGFACDRDVTRLITCGVDQRVKVWEFGSGQILAASESYGTWIRSVACDISGTIIVSGGGDGVVRIFSADAESQVVTIDSPGTKVMAMSCDKTGNQLASGGDDKVVRVWEAATGEQLAELGSTDRPVRAVAFDPTGGRVACAGGTIRVWDLASPHEEVATLGGSGMATAATFDRSGRRLVAGFDDGSIRVWDIDSREPAIVLEGHDQQVTSLSFDASGSLMVSGAEDGLVRLWDTTTWEGVSAFETTNKMWVQSVTFHPDGNQVVSGGYGGTVQVWDVEGEEEVAAIDHASWVGSVDFDTTGRFLAIGDGDGVVQVWDLLHGTRVTQLRLDGSIYTCRWVRQNQLAIGTGYGLHLLRLVSADR